VVQQTTGPCPGGFGLKISMHPWRIILLNSAIKIKAACTSETSKTLPTTTWCKNPGTELITSDHRYERKSESIKQVSVHRLTCSFSSVYTATHILF
jgi:hypothetical protein